MPVKGRQIPLINIPQTFVYLGNHFQISFKSLDSEARVLLFDPLCGDHYIEISTSKLSHSCLIAVEGERIAAESIRSIWNRWKPGVLSAEEDLQSLIAKDFALKEWKTVIRSLTSYLSHARWLNPLAVSELLTARHTS